jgi:hypothetical protein
LGAALQYVTVPRPPPQGPRLGEAESLKLLDSFIHLHVVHVMEAAIVRGAARLTFREKRDEWFRTNPANCLPYQALVALEERSVVHIAEHLKDDTQALDLPADIRRSSDLLLHRNALSHPYTLTWRRGEMQRFHDEERHWRDVRPALVWGLQLEVNELLRRHSIAPTLTGIEVTPGMAVMHSGIMRLTMTPDAVVTVLPTEAALVDALAAFRDRYLDFVLTHLPT